MFTVNIWAFLNLADVDHGVNQGVATHHLTDSFGDHVNCCNTTAQKAGLDNEGPPHIVACAHLVPHFLPQI